jgi:hypothetical protein
VILLGSATRGLLFLFFFEFLSLDSAGGDFTLILLVLKPICKGLKDFLDSFSVLGTCVLENGTQGICII